MRSAARSFATLREALATMPLVDCHDHSGSAGPKPTDPVKAVIDWYMRSDLESASSGPEVEIIFDEKRSLEERWPVLEKAWKRTEYTGYAQVVKRSLRHFYGEENLSLDGLRRIRERMLDFSDPAAYEKVLDEARIKVRLEDVWMNAAAIEGTLALPPRSRLAISLPGYHKVCNWSEVQANAAPLKRTVTSLEEYLDVCHESFLRCKQTGAVCFKDQSAYTRSLAYGNPSRAEAEAAFNWFMVDPRRSLSYPEGNKPLGDFLFHQFMRMARDMDLPVQIHTGHMAGIRNEITKTNAVLLTSLIELHMDTRFDLFHANWPYSGELLFLGKNYSNVAIDFCWANMVDPIYCQQMFQQAISCMPHAKIHAYGSDLDGAALCSAWAHAELARDNIAIALSNLVEMEYLNLDEAISIASDWLFGNANQFFKLGLNS
jgi:uncharacterized protein